MARTPARGDIYLIDLEPTKGKEQRALERAARRPTAGADWTGSPSRGRELL